MCLTIPKKVIAIEEDGLVTVESPDGTRQELKTIVELRPGDFCLTQQNVAIEKVDGRDYKEIFEIIREKIHGKKNKDNSERAGSS